MLKPPADKLDWALGVLVGLSLLGIGAFCYLNVFEEHLRWWVLTLPAGTTCLVASGMALKAAWKDVKRSTPPGWPKV